MADLSSFPDGPSCSSNLGAYESLNPCSMGHSSELLGKGQPWSGRRKVAADDVGQGTLSEDTARK